MDDNDNKVTPFHIRLRELRDAHGLSYRGLAEALAEEGVKITHTAVRKWEQGQPSDRPPKPAHIAALSRVFRVKPSFLLEDIFADKKLKTDRLSKWLDVDLLSEEEHSNLLDLKRLLLESRVAAPNGIGNK